MLGRDRFLTILILSGLLFFSLGHYDLFGQDGAIYGSVGNDIIIVDETSGTVTSIGTTPAFSDIESITYDFATGVVYALVDNSSNPRLGIVDLNTGVLTVVGDLSTPTVTVGSAEGISFHPDTGILYAVVNQGGGLLSNHLATLDPLTGDATIINPISGSVENEMDKIEFVGSTLYGIDGTLVTNQFLYTVDLVSGNAALIGGPFANVVGLAHDRDDDILYGISFERDFVTVNPITAAVSIIGPTHAPADFGGDRPRGLTWIPDEDNDLILDPFDFGDRDSDGIADFSDFDPTGYFYCRDNGQILTGGSISVAGPGVANIILDGSTGQYQWTVPVAGVYTMTINPPAGTTVDNAFQDLTNLDPTAQPNPFVLGPGEFGATGTLAAGFPTTFFVNFDLAIGDPIVINNNIPLVGAACVVAVVGGDPPIWENIMVFPTPEKFEGRDLNSDGDLNDTILRYQNLDTEQIFNTGISVSQNHRDIDIYGDNIVFVSRNDSLLSAIRRWFNPSGEIGVYNIKTKQTKMLGVWGDRPSIYQNTISISGSEIRYYDLNTSQLVETGIRGYDQAVWGVWIAYEAADNIICLYNISSGQIVKTGAEGEFPTIHKNIVAFERNEQLYYYDIESAQVTHTGYAGEDAVVYGDRIVYSASNKIYYYDISQQQAFSTGKSGLEPDIFEDTITYYVWEDWNGTDVNFDGDRQDPIVNTFTISESDRPLRAATPASEVAAAAIHSIQGSRDSQGIVFNVQGAGIESSQLEIYSLSGGQVFDSGSVDGTQLRWNLKRQDGAVLANGVYLYRVLVTGAGGEVIGSDVRKLLLMR